MNILISGGTGLVGRALVPILQSQGHNVTILTTRKSMSGNTREGVRYIWWNPARHEFPAQEMEWADGIVHLAGYSVANRWTEENKKRMVASRVDSTEVLVQAALQAVRKPHWFISAGAIGYYPSSSDWQDEQAPMGSGFLADLCHHWEELSQPLETAGIRRIVLRIGVVLDRHEGALKQMLPLFRLGLGAPVGHGRQWMSWIHLHDLVRAIAHLAKHPEARGIYNAVAPEPVTNRDFSKELARSLGRKGLLPPVPAFMLRLIFGEMSSMVLASQRISCDKLQHTGFVFQYPRLKEALNSLTSS